MTTVNKSTRPTSLYSTTTLRDGEQCPGATMTFGGKLDIAEMLDRHGAVDVIEPVSRSLPKRFPGRQRDRPAFQELRDCRPVAGIRKTSTAVLNAVKFARRGRVTRDRHLALHMRVKLNMTPEQVLELSTPMSPRAQSHSTTVGWSAEDGTAAKWDFLCRIVEAVIKAGATTVNIRIRSLHVPDEYHRTFMRP